MRVICEHAEVCSVGNSDVPPLEDVFIRYPTGCTGLGTWDCYWLAPRDRKPATGTCKMSGHMENETIHIIEVP
jgi:hypothetical protein